MAVIGLDHVQLAMPPNGEARAREFYRDVLGLVEIPKPRPLARRGGLWFHCGSLQLHLGVEADFRPARKAHPGLLVRDLPSVIRACEAAGYHPHGDEALEGYDRVFVTDPFGNRLELLEPR
ncbi:MAG TPA: VOC family protein [Methylomirabilota bacterium]